MSDAAAETSDAPISREYEHQLLPVPGVWNVDPMHSCLAFECRHMLLTPMRGWFSSYSGQFNIAEVPEESSVEVTIDAESLQTPSPPVAAGLVGENLLQADKYKTLHFKSTSVQHVEADLWKITGDLTIRDTTREVVLDASFEGVIPSPPPFGGVRARTAFLATTEFDRRDFGMDWNVPLPDGGWLVGNRVVLTLDVEATLA